MTVNCGVLYMLYVRNLFRKKENQFRVNSGEINIVKAYNSQD